MTFTRAKTFTNMQLFYKKKKKKKNKKKKSSKVEEPINSKMVNIELVKDQLITINTIWAQ